MGHFYYQINNINHYNNEANKLSSSLLEERLGALYSNYSPPHTFTNSDENKIVFETSFASYQGMKVYI